MSFIIATAFSAVPRDEWSSGPLFVAPDDAEAANYLRHIVAPEQPKPRKAPAPREQPDKQMIRNRERRAAVVAYIEARGDPPKPRTPEASAFWAEVVAACGVGRATAQLTWWKHVEGLD